MGHPVVTILARACHRFSGENNIFSAKCVAQKHGCNICYAAIFQEWGAACPPVVAGYRLEHDHSWTPVKNVEEKNNANEMIEKILRANAAGSKLQLTFGN